MLAAVRPSRLLLALAGLLGAASCQPTEHAVLIEVHTQADLETLRVLVLSLDVPRPTAEQVRRVARSADDINADPLRVAVDLLGPAHVLVHLVGTTPSGERLVATRCYPVDGVLRDSVMLFGPFDALDLDGDGFVSDPTTVCREPGPDGQSAVSCDGDLYVCPGDRAADCDDSSADIHPGAAPICLDGVDQDCDGEDEPCGDQDGDGWDACPAVRTGPCDCNDNVPGINPGAEDICLDGIDQDCDGADACCDADGDGSPRCGPAGPDCNDMDASIRPGATEVCDGIDNNCNDQVDELDECRGPDLDGDGVAACGREEPGEPCDCNDCDRGIHQGARELCGPRVDPSVPGNGIDEDCDGMIDEGCPAGDLDGDGVEPPRDCDDADPLAFPPSGGREPIDYCEDGRANNCIPGEDASCSGDTDGDGWVEPAACETSPAINPTATEICNAVDDDCDGVQDEVLSLDNSVGCVNGTTIVFATDFLNCGGCRVLCNAQTSNRCGGGRCECEWNAGADECAATDTCCPGIGCRNLDEDEDNCGICGNPCGAGETCVAGVCTCGGTTAALGEDACPESGGGLEANICCGTSCRDVSRDDANCGMCGLVCGLHSACTDRRCECDAPTATETWADCNGDRNNFGNDGCEVNVRRTDEAPNPPNCGACGRTCMPAQATGRCAMGACAIASCGTNFADCNSSATDGCETPTNTLTNCGGCGAACDTSRADGCNGTSCRCGGTAACGSSDRCCGGACVPRTSMSHCGACGAACDATRADNCDGTNCRCGSGLQCGASERCCGGTCVPRTSTSHCGACGTACNLELADNCNGTACRCGGGAACSGTQRCCGGTCVPRTSTSHCGGCGSACDLMTANACNGTSCQCGSGVPCSGERCCGSGCVSLTSTSHCGACGAACDPVTSDSCNGTSCRCGSGAACSGSQRCCGGTCVPRTSLSHCGACGTSCNLQISDTCSGSACECGTSAACNPSTQRCCGGSCVAQTSTSHCGGCGMACNPMVADSCNGTACRCGGGAQCTGGQICCGGACVNPNTDEANCGGCGVACGGNETCTTGGVCVCGDSASSDPAGTPGGGAACSGATPVCCNTTAGNGDDRCAADMTSC